VNASLLTRIRWRLEDRLYSLERSLRHQEDAKVLVGVLVFAALVAGGFLAAKELARASSGSASQATVRPITVRQKVRVRIHGHVVTRWRVRKVLAQAQTVLETQTVHTPNGIRLVTHPVTRYRVVYRKHLVKVHGKTRTVLQPVHGKTLTDTRTLTKTSTQFVTLTRQVTNQEFVTVTQPVTNTVVSTETDTLPLTITVTVTTHPGNG
jgi:hypothetical protein